MGSIFGIRRGTEEVPYKVVAQKGEVELRQYCERIVIETLMRSESKSEQNSAFMTLAGYIFGKNDKKESIPMTAPVEVRPNERCRVDGDTPVTASLKKKLLSSGEIMRFTLPKTMALDEAPLPLVDNINIDKAGPQLFAVLRFSGAWKVDVFEQRGEELMKDVRHSLAGEYEAVGPVLHWSYDPPWTLPCFRRNEVAVEVQKKKEKTFQVSSLSVA